MWLGRILHASFGCGLRIGVNAGFTRACVVVTSDVEHAHSLNPSIQSDSFHLALWGDYRTMKSQVTEIGGSDVVSELRDYEKIKAETPLNAYQPS